MMSWVIAMLVLGLLVFLHEGGHFLVARWSGVRILRFSIGFGPRLFGWQRGETEYAVSLLPLGGYVKMAGEQREEHSEDPRAFLAQPVGVRARIVAAGPFVNVLVSMAALWIALVTGYPELLPTVGRVIDEMPAHAAGLQVGDRILAVNGTPVRTWDELTSQITRSPNQALTLRIDRDGTPRVVPITPTEKQITDPFGRAKRIGLIGITPSGAFESYRLPPGLAFVRTCEKQAEWAKQIVLSVWSLMLGRISPKESLTGPIGIVYMTSEAAKMGLGSLLYLMSIFSLSLAVFNVFPMPVLDGGHLFFLAIEKLRGHPISVRIEQKATQVGVALLLTAVVLICMNDLNRFGLWHKVMEWWQR